MVVYLVRELKGVAKNPVPGTSLNPRSLVNLSLDRIAGYCPYGHKVPRSRPVGLPLRTDGVDLTLTSGRRLYFGAAQQSAVVLGDNLRLVPRAGAWSFAMGGAAAVEVPPQTLQLSAALGFAGGSTGQITQSLDADASLGFAGGEVSA